MTGSVRKMPEFSFAGITVSSPLWKMIVLISLKGNSSQKGLMDFLPCRLYRMNHDQSCKNRIGNPQV